ncbi:hypothetical protein [Sphingomonas sp.]|uniref:hypothetical protein n=1 Tax=Sphingomonas sp. TaxID=28214 RepID=UPI002ED9642D
MNMNSANPEKPLSYKVPLVAAESMTFTASPSLPTPRMTPLKRVNFVNFDTPYTHV